MRRRVLRWDGVALLGVSLEPPRRAVPVYLVQSSAEVRSRQPTARAVAHQVHLRRAWVRRERLAHRRVESLDVPRVRRIARGFLRPEPDGEQAAQDLRPILALDVDDEDVEAPRPQRRGEAAARVAEGREVVGGVISEPGAHHDGARSGRGELTVYPGGPREGEPIASWPLLLRGDARQGLGRDRSDRSGRSRAQAVRATTWRRRRSGRSGEIGARGGVHGVCRAVQLGGCLHLVVGRPPGSQLNERQPEKKCDLIRIPHNCRRDEAGFGCALRRGAHRRGQRR